MKAIQLKHLMQVIRDKLMEEKNITILGWVDSNHSPKTRVYEKTGRVIFVEIKSKVAKVKGDFVIFTEFVSHSDIKRSQKSANSLYPHTVSIGEIKIILSKFENLIVPKKTKVPKKYTGLDILFHNKPESTISLNTLEKQLIRTEVKVDTYDKLAQLFMTASLLNPEGLVGAQTLGKMIREVELPKRTTPLIKSGWIVPVTQDGKSKVGWYKAGEKLKEKMNIGKIEEPKDIIEKAQFLMDRRSFHESKIKELRTQIEFHESEIERGDSSELLLQKLKEL